jgi:DNA-binding CsgD family transcriptional regulator
VLAGRLATVLHWLGRNEQVEPVAGAVLRTTTDPELAARMALTLARATKGLPGRLDEALGVCRRALDNPAVPAHWRGRLRAEYAVLLSARGAPEAAAQAETALSEGERAGDRLSIGWARHALYWACEASDATALAHLDRGLSVLSDDPESVDLRLTMECNRANTLACLDRLGEASAVLEAALVLAERAGASERLAWVQLRAADVSFEAGDWDKALVHLDSVAPPSTVQNLLTLHGLAALVASHRGDQATAGKHVAAVSDVPTTGQPRTFTAHLVAARAVALEVAGDQPGAMAELATWLDPKPGEGDYRADWMPELVRLALAAGDTGTARAATELCEADAAQPGAPAHHVAVARRCRAMLVDDAAGLLAVAEDYRGVGRLFNHAGTLEEAAVRLAQRGDVPAARAALTDAVGGYLAAGAHWDVRRAEARLRPFGVRLGPRGRSRRAAFGWEALTPTEQRIARLVAQGRSNPDIATELYLSRRTVQTHVSHILRKLRLRSRAEVAREIP